MSFDVERIQKSSRRVSKFLKKRAKRPTLNAVHNLRISTRTLETTFKTLGLDSKGKVKRLLRDLKDVRNRAGKVRDMDVLTANGLTVKHDGEQDCLVQLLEFLGAKRNGFARKLQLTIQAAGPRLRRGLKQNSKRVDKILRDAEDNPADSDATSASMAKAIELVSDLKRPARLNRNNLHSYRLKVKKLRDVLQLSDRADEQEFVRKLGEVKNAIGEWHDWEELIAMAIRVLDHGNCALIRQLRTTSDAKYEHALSLTSRLRNHYVKPEPLSTQVLGAASAIAQR